MVPTGGFEPPASPLPRVRSNLLSHVGTVQKIYKMLIEFASLGSLKNPHVSSGILRLPGATLPPLTPPMRGLVFSHQLQPFLHNHLSRDIKALPIFAGGFSMKGTGGAGKVKRHSYPFIRIRGKPEERMG